MREWLHRLDARLFPPAPEAVRKRLGRLQYKRLHQQLPLLHLVAMFNMVLVIAIAYRDGASGLVLGLMCLLPLFNVVRIIFWRRKVAVERSDEEITRSLRSATIAVVCGLGLASALCVNTYARGVFSQPEIIPISLAYGTFCVAHSLSPLRRAAILSLIIGIVPNAVYMAMSNEFMASILSVSAMSVAVLLTRFIYTQFEQMIASLELEQLVSDQANTDALSGLYNRRGFLGRLESHVQGGGRRFAIAIIDLDGFKQINDRMGHFAGDEYLSLVAGRIEAGRPAPGFAGRLGGDEFVVMFDEPYDLAAAGNAVEAMLETVCKPMIVEGTTVPVSASIGYALYPEDASNVSDLLVAADIALYAAKNAGKSRAAAYANVDSGNTMPTPLPIAARA